MHPATSNLGLALMCFSALLFIVSALAASSELTIQSTAFVANGAIPVEYTCSGDNKSPSLTWSGVPAATKSMALIVRDPDAPMGSYVHWVLYSLPARARGLPAGLPTTETLEDGVKQGVNGSGTRGYHGPCPPPGPAHHYHFRLYALDIKLNIPAGANADDVEQVIRGHVLASADLVGTFAR
jgi:Raf kinase inhibitor-like YbhB/YbcL family protein